MIGEKGAAGEKGEVGVQGERGNDGERGETGIAGPRGFMVNIRQHEAFRINFIAKFVFSMEQFESLSEHRIE